MLVLALALAAEVAASGDTSRPILETLATVCRPASEGGRAPRDLALAQGFQVDDPPPASVQAIFPATRLGSVSLVKQVGAARVRVTSTVLLPPATIYSCLITSDVAPADLLTQVGAAVEPSGYVAAPAPEGATPTGVTMATWTAKRAGAADKIIVVRRSDTPVGSMILSYRVDAASLRAADELVRMCKAGAAPHPEITCTQATGR